LKQEKTVLFPVRGRVRLQALGQISLSMHCIGELIEPIAT